MVRHKFRETVPHFRRSKGGATSLFHNYAEARKMAGENTPTTPHLGTRALWEPLGTEGRGRRERLGGAGTQKTGEGMEKGITA